MILHRFALLLLLSACLVAAQTQPAAVSRPDSRNAPNDPVLHDRPSASTIPAAKPKRIQLDVVVTDAAGKPVLELQPWDFKLLDNDRPSKILYYRAFGAVQPDPPVEVILVLNLMNLSVQQAALVRDQLGRFLQQNGGALAQPVTLMVLTEKGLQVQPRPSRDGTVIAATLKTLSPHVSSFNPAMGIRGAIERFNRSIGQVRMMAENETRKPGRKLLIWVGAGWPMLETQNYVPSQDDKAKYFRSIVQLSNWLREAHMVVYSLSSFDPNASVGRSTFYQGFLKPVLTAKDAESGNLALRVLAAQTGGQVLGPSNDLVAQVQRCLGDANNFYQLTFEPVPAEHPDEYHALKITVNQPGVTVRTQSGYYSEPQ